MPNCKNQETKTISAIYTKRESTPQLSAPCGGNSGRNESILEWCKINKVKQVKVGSSGTSYINTVLSVVSCIVGVCDAIVVTVVVVIGVVG